MAFKIGHKHYTTKGDFKKGHTPWNKDISVWLEKECSYCGKSFKIRKCHITRGRGKYCSKECMIKSITIHPKTPADSIAVKFRLLDEYKLWRMGCLRRDWFKCQECSSKDKLEVHHVKLFRTLVEEFLSTYNQFSPIEDRETLARLAVTYKPFWDIDNGVTYCRRCHRVAEHRLRNKEKS